MRTHDKERQTSIYRALPIHDTPRVMYRVERVLLGAEVL